MLAMVVQVMAVFVVCDAHARMDVAPLSAAGSPRTSTQSSQPGATRTTTQATGTNAYSSGSGGGSLEEAVDYAQILAALVALGAFISLALQIRWQRRDARAEWTLSYQQTFNDRAFRTIASKATGFFDAADAKECVDKIRALDEAEWADAATLPRSPPTTPDAQASNNDLRYLLGFYETLALAYNSNKIDRELIIQDIAAPAVYSLMDSWWYICWRRDGKLVGESHLYEQFELFVKAARSERDHLMEAANPTPGIRLLCLPPPGASADEWELAGRVSKALSERVQVLKGVPAQLVASVTAVVQANESRRPAGWTPTGAAIDRVIAVPEDIDTTIATWSEDRDRAEEIRRLVIRLSHIELEAALPSL